MTGNLIIHFFEGGKLQQNRHEGITKEEALALVTKAMSEVPNVQLTWLANDGN